MAFSHQVSFSVLLKGRWSLTGKWVVSHRTLIVFVRVNVSAYTELGGDEELPLGEEFQELLKRFVRPHEKKVPKRIELVRKLVDQLA